MEFVLGWVKEKKPLNFELLFGNNNAVQCEIGFGDGSFLVHKAKENPDKNFIGIDYSIVSTKKASKKLSNSNLSNVILINLDAESAFQLLIPECSLEYIYVNFPDPWPKKKHHKRRLIDRSFSLLTASRSKKDGGLIIVTDDPFYRDFTLEEIVHYKVWRPIFKSGFVQRNEGYFETKYERKWRSLGKKIYYMQFKKVLHPIVEHKIVEFKYNDNIKIKVKPDKLRSFVYKPITMDDYFAKIISLNHHSEGLKFDVVLKDYSLFQKKTLSLGETPDNNTFILKTPPDLFKGFSFKLLLETIRED